MKKLNVSLYMVGAEVAPFFKAGGLADVMGSLPKALHKNVRQVAVLCPFNQEAKTRLPTKPRLIDQVRFPFYKGSVRVRVWKSYLPHSSVPVYLFDSQRYLNRGTAYQGTAVYDPITQKAAAANVGNAIRYLFFSQAVASWITAQASVPMLIHCNDWHTAPVIPLLQQRAKTSSIKSIFTVHNLAQLGGVSLQYLQLLHCDVSQALASELPTKRIHLIRLGLVYADVITAVSPQYAKEILTKEYGCGQEHLLRQRRKDIYGVLNGIDTDLFNPNKDAYIKKRYTIRTAKHSKALNKRALQKEIGLPQRDVPVFGLVSRLSSQKGLDLLVPLLPKLAELDVQFILEGTGLAKLTQPFHDAQAQWPDTVYFHNIFDVPFAQRIYASADMFLMPSKFEPCGLGQLIAMRYGAVPIVRATGGLQDTVFEGKNGFVFRPYSTAALWRTIQRALHVYHYQSATWQSLVRRGMSGDYSWDKSAKHYVTLYKS